MTVGRNEAKTLPRLLSSLKEFFARGGEMVYVDTGSTDGSATVARDGGAKVFEVGDRFKYVVDEQTAATINKKFVVPPDPDIIAGGDSFFAFDKARNYAKSLASNDFICTPDCDEAWTTLNIDKINDLIAQGYEKFLIEFVFAHNPDGTPSVAFCADTRFYDRRKIEWKGIIHETMRGDAKTIRVGKDVAYLEHYQNRETNREKYLAGLAWACAAEPANDRNSHYFARELMYKGRFHSAIKEFQRHIDMNQWADERGQSMVYMGTCYEAIGQVDEALGWWHRAFELTGSRREPLINLAYYWKKQNRPAMVAAYAAAALQIPNNGFYANRVANYTYEPHSLLYWAKGWMGDIPAARQNLLKCLEYHPTEESFIRDMQYYFTPEEIDAAKVKAGLTINPIVKDKPLVSILMPAYNVGAFIGKAIESVRGQTLRDWELIITDDGSTDTTLDIAKGYADLDGRIKVFSHGKNLGYPVAFNECLKHAQGKYIARMDADDWQEPTRMEKSVARLESTPVCDCVSTNTFYGPEGGEVLVSTEREGMVPEKYMDFACYGHGGAPVNATIVARREVYDTVGGFDTSTNYGIDSEWDVKVNMAGFRWAYLDEPLYHYRRHDNQNVNKRSSAWYAEQQRNFLERARPFWADPFNPTRHIEVMVTGKCNKKCRYCSQAEYNEAYKDYQTPVELIKKLCARAKEIGARYEWIQFSGGEPFLWDHLEEACAVAKDAGFKVRVFSNASDTVRMGGVLTSGVVDAIYTNSTNADPRGVKFLQENYPDKAIIAPLEHKPLPASPLTGVLPARCNCNHPTVIENNVYPCGNFFEHITRLGRDIGDYKDYFCTLDDDWISFFRKVDRFNMDICSYCLANGRVWERIPYGENLCAGAE